MDKQLSKIDKKLQALAIRIEKLQIAEYIELISKPKKFILLNFVSGLAKGIGMAIGFTILTAIIIYGLSRLAYINIPVIGQYISEIAKIVQENL